MMTCNRCSGRRGFTLIEIVIVTAILSLFATVIYSAFFTTIRSVRVTEQLNDSFQPARVILRRIQTDLKGAIHRPNDERYIFQGVDGIEIDGNSNHDRVDFITCSNSVAWSEKPQSDLAEISYYISRQYPDKGYLVRRKDIYLDDEPEKGGEVEIVGENVKGLNFRYFQLGRKEREDGTDFDWNKTMEENTWWELVADPDNWYDDWDWEEDPFMPILVRVELTVLDENDEESTFATTVYLTRDSDTIPSDTGTEKKTGELHSVYEDTGTGKADPRGSSGDKRTGEGVDRGSVRDKKTNTTGRSGPIE